jgi:hypothetical protein
MPTGLNASAQRRYDLDCCASPLSRLILTHRQCLPDPAMAHAKRARRALGRPPIEARPWRISVVFFIAEGTSFMPTR